MNWKYLRKIPWVDTRARFVSAVPKGGTLLDVGSSDGETLGHIHELRPDLRLRATDLCGQPESYPGGCVFHRGNLEVDPLPWLEGSIDAITCMHLVEHLHSLEMLLDEASRVLKVGGMIYFETPHPRTMMLNSPSGSAVGTFTMNFFDDPTHVRPVAVGCLAQSLRSRRLEPQQSGTSRNLLFGALWPFYFWLPSSRKKFTSKIHWLGWSAYLIARKGP